MVHVLDGVLAKVHRALRAGGRMLVVQPAQLDPIVQLEVGGKVRFERVYRKPNFDGYLRATLTALQHGVDGGLFVLEKEATTPEGPVYHPKEYESLEAWIEDRRPLCDDLEAFDTLTASMRQVAGGRQHRIVYYSKEYKALFHKLGP